MALDIHLDLQHVGDFHPPQTRYVDALHEVSTMLSDICMAIGEAGGGIFDFTCLGQRWPVQVSTELCILLEQLPQVLLQLGERDVTCSIEFYEQGLCRTIRISGTGENLCLACESTDDCGEPPKQQGSISRTKLIRQLTSARDELMRFLESRAPSIAAHPWLRRWHAESAP